MDDEEIIDNNPELRDAFMILQKELQKDPSYAYGWHANLAMAYYDAMPEVFWLPDNGKLLEIANEGATVFMKRAFNVDTSQDMLLREPGYTEDSE